MVNAIRGNSDQVPMASCSPPRLLMILDTDTTDSWKRSKRPDGFIRRSRFSFGKDSRGPIYDRCCDGKASCSISSGKHLSTEIEHHGGARGTPD